jgi:hypothetical protein
LIAERLGFSAFTSTVVAAFLLRLVELRTTAGMLFVDTVIFEACCIASVEEPAGLIGFSGIIFVVLIFVVAVGLRCRLCRRLGHVVPVTAQLAYLSLNPEKMQAYVHRLKWGLQWVPDTQWPWLATEGRFRS